MPNCIFCLKPADSLTREHVFPAVIGGTLEVPNATCAPCNNGFSNKFEQKTSNRLSHFRRLFGIANRDGKLPTIDASVTVDGRTVPARLAPDGTMRLIPKKTEIKDENQKVREIVYEHLPENERANLRNRYEEAGWEFLEETAPGGKTEVSISGSLDLLDSPEMLRLVAKIAYVALAYKAGTTFARAATFQTAHDFIQTGVGDNTVRLFSNEEFREFFPQGPHQHSVILAGRHDKHIVESVVTLFGGLNYFVTLSRTYDGADFSWTLVLDAHRGESNKALVTGFDTEFLQIEHLSGSPNTVWDNQKLSGKSFLDYLAGEIDAIEQRQRNQAPNSGNATSADSHEDSDHL